MHLTAHDRDRSRPHIFAIRPVQNPQDVDGDVLDSGVTPDAGDGEYAYLLAPVRIECHGEGHRVVHAGVGVDDELLHSPSDWFALDRGQEGVGVDGMTEGRNGCSAYLTTLAAFGGSSCSSVQTMTCTQTYTTTPSPPPLNLASQRMPLTCRARPFCSRRADLCRFSRLSSHSFLSLPCSPLVFTHSIILPSSVRATQCAIYTLTCITRV